MRSSTYRLIERAGVGKLYRQSRFWLKRLAGRQTTAPATIASGQQVPRPASRYDGYALPSGSVRVPGCEATAEVLPWPHPYRAGFALANDCEYFSWDDFCTIHQWLTTAGATPFGQGLGLPVSGSFWFFSEDPENLGFSYFEADDWMRKSRRAPQLAELLKSGFLDTLHTYGGFDVRGGFRREHAQAAVEELNRLGVRLSVWTNHGSALNVQNLGGQWANDYAKGDLPGSRVYHADVLAQAGFRYFWLDAFATNRFSLGTPQGRDFEDGLAAPDASPWGDRILCVDRLRDGQEVLVFRRFRGRRRFAPDPSSLADQISPQNLDHLEASGGAVILYQHLGCFRQSDGRAVGGRGRLPPSPAVKQLEALAERYRAQRIWVAPCAFFLRYLETVSDLHLDAESGSEGVVLTLSGHRHGLEEKELAGVSLRLRGLVQVDRIEIAGARGGRTACQSYRLREVAPDEKIISWPQPAWPEFPFAPSLADTIASPLPLDGRGAGGEGGWSDPGGRQIPSPRTPVPSNGRGELQCENDRWLDAFERTHGRRLRVLHIGNVANNAYLNAKILNARGIDCDVVCADYYHIMACPEWEDADFRGKIGDQFFPDWEAVDLRGFRRPAWFAQGPMRYCIAYLVAKRLGRRLATPLYWTYLRARRWYTCSRRLQGVRNMMGRIRAGWFGRTARRIKRGAVWTRCAAGVVVRRVKRRNGPALNTRYPVPSIQHSSSRRMEELIAAFGEFFPDRVDRLTTADLTRNRLAAGWWQRLLRHYDVVIGYAIEGKWPLLAGSRPYFAYEHGTIRNIPFEDNEQGRMCAITYRAADGVFITNCDNVRSAERLGLENYRFIPHPVNEDLGGDRQSSERLRAELRERLDSDFVVFHPPRQHWEPRRHPDWEKGNDLFLRGFSRFVHEVNRRASAVLVEWGQTIQASKDLLASLGVAERVLWIAPQPNLAMIRYVQACDLLADQFFLGAFGSTMPKALLHGCPAMLYLDEDRHHWCFPEMPPVINAGTVEQVFEGLARLYRDPDYAQDLIRRGRAWYAKHHSNEVIAETFVQAFRESLECRGSRPLSFAASATPVSTLPTVPIQSGVEPPHSKGAQSPHSKMGAGR